MSRLFQPLKWALRTPRSLASRLRWTKPLQPAPQTEVRYMVTRGKAGVRRVEKLVIGGISIFCFVQFVDIVCEAQGLDGEIIIPLPFTKTAFPREPYKGSDPEWREFVKLSKNPPLKEAIKRGLAELVADSISKRIQLEKNLAWEIGGGEVKIRTWLLNLDYPPFPPLEVGTYRILIDDENIALVLQRVEPATQEFVDQVWWPSAMVHALWSVGTYLFKQRTSPATQHLEPGQGPSDGTTAPGSLSTSHDGGLQKGHERGKNESAGPEWRTNPARIKESLMGSKAAAASGNTPQSPANGWSVDGLSAFTRIREVFWKSYILGRPRAPLPPPRGCVSVGGVVELETEKCYLTVDVFGWYNPKTGQFDNPSTLIRARRIAKKHQGPLK